MGHGGYSQGAKRDVTWGSDHGWRGHDSDGTGCLTLELWRGEEARAAAIVEGGECARPRGGLGDDYGTQEESKER